MLPGYDPDNIQILSECELAECMEISHDTHSISQLHTCAQREMLDDKEPELRHVGQKEL